MTVGQLKLKRFTIFVVEWEMLFGEDSRWFYIKLVCYTMICNLHCKSNSFVILSIHRDELLEFCIYLRCRSNPLTIEYNSNTIVHLVSRLKWWLLGGISNYNDYYVVMDILAIIVQQKLDIYMWQVVDDVISFRYAYVFHFDIAESIWIKTSWFIYS